MFKRTGIILCLFLILSLMAGCAVRPKLHITPTPLSPRATATYYYLKYLDLAKEKRFKPAYEYLKKVAALAPSPEVFIEEARLLYNMKRLADAKAALKLGLQKYPGNRDLVFYLTTLYLWENKIYNAYSLLRIYIKKHPHDIKARKLIADILFEDKKYQEVLKYLGSIPEKKRDFKVEFLLGRTYIRLGKTKQGIVHLKRATQLNPDFYRGWAELAYQYELVNDLVSAEKIYSTLLSKGFANRELIFRLIDINIKLNNPQKAYSLAKQMLSDPKDIIDSAALFLKAGLYTRAESLLKSIEQFSDEYPRILYFQSIIFFKRDGDLHRAIETLDKIPSTSSIYMSVLKLKIKFLIRAHKYRKAESLLKNAITNYPQEKLFYLLLSDLYVMKKEINKAILVIKEGIGKIGEDEDLLFQLGTLYYKEGKLSQAMDIMEKILKKDPDHASALNFVGYTLVDMNKDLARGYKLISKALKLQPRNGYFLDSMAWYYYKIGDFKKAWDYIKKAVVREKNDPTIWEHYGDIARELGMFKEAQKGYKKSLKLHPRKPKEVEKKLHRLTTRHK